MMVIPCPPLHVILDALAPHGEAEGSLLDEKLGFDLQFLALVTGKDRCNNPNLAVMNYRACDRVHRSNMT